MDKNIKVDVFIFTYNFEEFIQRAIRSVLNQSYHNIRIVICDDYSNDNTIEEAHKVNSDKVEIYRNPGKYGMWNNRNWGFKNLVENPYVMILDGDDYIIDPFKIEAQLSLFHKNPDLGLVSTDINRVNVEDNIIKANVKKKFNAPEIFSIDFLYKNLGLLSASTFMIKSDLLRNILPLPDFLAGMDPYIGLSVAETHNVGFINKPTINAVYHDKNTTKVRNFVRKKSIYIYRLANYFLSKSEFINSNKSSFIFYLGHHYFIGKKIIEGLSFNDYLFIYEKYGFKNFFKVFLFFLFEYYMNIKTYFLKKIMQKQSK